MRTVTGAILIAASEQAFSHAHLIGFPNHVFARDILLPASVVFAVGGIAFVIWGVLTDGRTTSS
ncbi:MAG: hypothetical protein CMJ64_16275 [Planctomycetaceae bacterium]|nr:hypothetical protein [Planctomycetaceae bacterium]